MEVDYNDCNDCNNITSDLNKISEENLTNINNLLEKNQTNLITINNAKITKFSHDKKMEIKKKIEKIKKKEYLVDIFKIIEQAKEFTENTNGVFFFFHDLPDEIYEKLDNYVNNIYKLHKKNTSVSNVLNSEISETINDTSDKNIDKHLTNKEKVIFRRKKYEEYLNHNQE
jgi:hypothetical protein